MWVQNRYKGQIHKCRVRVACAITVTVQVMPGSFVIGMALAVFLPGQLVNYVSKRVIQHDSVVNFMLIGKAQITFPLVRFALKRAIMLHSVTSYKLIVASVVRKTGEPWGRQAWLPRKEIASARNRSPPPTRRSHHTDFVNTCSGIFPDDSHGNDVDDYDSSDSHGNDVDSSDSHGNDVDDYDSSDSHDNDVDDYDSSDSHGNDVDDYDCSDSDQHSGVDN